MCSGSGKSGWPRLQRITLLPSVFSTSSIRDPKPKAASVPINCTRFANIAVLAGVAPWLFLIRSDPK